MVRRVNIIFKQLNTIINKAHIPKKPYGRGRSFFSWLIFSQHFVLRYMHWEVFVSIYTSEKRWSSTPPPPPISRCTIPSVCTSVPSPCTSRICPSPRRSTRRATCQCPRAWDARCEGVRSVYRPRTGADIICVNNILSMIPEGREGETPIVRSRRQRVVPRGCENKSDHPFIVCTEENESIKRMII